VVEISGADSCDVTELRVGSWEFIAKDFNMNGQDDLQDFSAWLSELSNKESTIVKVGFTGTINLAIAAQLDELLDAQAELFASLRKRKRTTDLSIAPDEMDQENVALSGYAKEAWNDLIAASSDDSVAQDALRLCYRLSRRGVN
jgi:hypothetical protein